MDLDLNLYSESDSDSVSLSSSLFYQSSLPCHQSRWQQFSTSPTWSLPFPPPLPQWDTYPSAPSCFLLCWCHYPCHHSHSNRSHTKSRRSNLPYPSFLLYPPPPPTFPLLLRLHSLPLIFYSPASPICFQELLRCLQGWRVLVGTVTSVKGRGGQAQ